jgi:hypothetical protein
MQFTKLESAFRRLFGVWARETISDAQRPSLRWWAFGPKRASAHPTGSSGRLRLEAAIALNRPPAATPKML